MSDNEQESEKRETVADIVAEMRMGNDGGKPAYRIGRADKVEISMPSGQPIRSMVIEEVYISELADRLEAAWKREREASGDEILVKSCNTCKHFTRKRKWCRVHDYSPLDPSKLPLIWPNGPCPQWECNSHGGVEK